MSDSFGREPHLSVLVAVDDEVTESAAEAGRHGGAPLLTVLFHAHVQAHWTNRHRFESAAGFRDQLEDHRYLSHVLVESAWQAPVRNNTPTRCLPPSPPHHSTIPLLCRPCVRKASSPRRSRSRGAWSADLVPEAAGGVGCGGAEVGDLSRQVALLVLQRLSLRHGALQLVLGLLLLPKGRPGVLCAQHW